MRKSSGKTFVAIPTVPTTVSGQWLTYSHMANHYRKLLNVKPRVQTNAPKRPSLAALQASASKLPKKPSTTTKETRRSSDGVPSNTTLRTSRKSSHSQPIPAKAKSYHIIFDQSELNNLSEAVMSESEVDEPNVYQMGIDEKINLYLNHQLEYAAGVSDESQSARSSSPFYANSGPRSRERNLGRHSKCFIPHLDAVKGRQNPKLSPARAPKFKSSVGRTPAAEKAPPPQKLLSKKSKSSSAVILKPSANSKLQGLTTTVPPKNIKISTKPKTSMAGKKFDGAWDCGSSVGTVRGSDDMTDPPRLVSLLSQRTKSTRKVKGSELIGSLNGASPDWLPRGGNDIRTSANNNRQKTSASSSILPSGFVNKDSSRDSAYGFSSGESKITTRESTPEKMKSRNKKVHVTVETNGHGRPKYKSNLSTVASSINQESLGDSLSYNPTPVINSTNYPPKNSSNWTTEEKYVNFITTVTDDIIRREVFTNKGLKSLFMSHVEANKELDLEKMLQMLDRLRMDVGVPKDDSLNQMEFGYGSIKYSTGAFFPKQSSQSLDHESSAVPGQSSAGQPPNSFHNVPSDLTISELHHHRHLQNFNSGDESSKMSSCSGSLLNGNPAEPPMASRNPPRDIWDPHQEDFPCRDSKDSSSPSSKSSSGLSLTESEIQRALDEVGFDAKVTRDITRIVKGGTHRQTHQKLEILEQNNNKPSKSSESMPKRYDKGP